MKNTLKTLFRFITSGYKNAKKYYLLLLLCMLAFAMLTPLLINVQKNLIDKATNNIAFGLIASLIVFYFAIYYINSISITVIAFLKHKILLAVNKQETNEVMGQLINTAYSNLENSQTQNIIMRVNKKANKAYSQAIMLIPNSLKRVVELAGIFYFVTKAGVWWAFPLAILVSLPSFYFNKIRTTEARKVWRRNSYNIRYADYLNDTLLNKQAAFERRVFAFSQFLSNKWQVLFKKHNSEKIATFVKSSVATGLAMCFSLASLLVLALALLNPLKQGSLSIGLYTAILITVISKLNMCISSLVREYSNLQEIKHYVNDVNYLSELEQESHINENVLELKSIEFQDVYFKYPNDNKEVLSGVSFTINQQEVVGLLGLNGAGKTTITKLMMGIYSPNKGRILINGIDTGQLSPKSIRDIYAILPQNFAKYKDSMRLNIDLYHLNNSSDNKLKQCLVKNKAEVLIDKCKTDLNTIMTTEYNNGIDVSGGQWQKLASCRVGNSDRQFYILDEPTAALDPLAEVEYYTSFKDNINNKTTLFITHRLGASRLFDKCLVLDKGKIIEKGSHEDLINLNGVYKKLYDKQKHWYQQKEQGEILNVNY